MYISSIKRLMSIVNSIVIFFTAIKSSKLRSNSPIYKPLKGNRPTSHNFRSRSRALQRINAISAASQACRLYVRITFGIYSRFKLCIYAPG